MEAFLTWLAQNVAWETLKKALPENRGRELALLRRALEDAQNRNAELEGDRALLKRVVEQRNVAIQALTEAKRQTAACKKDLSAARKLARGRLP